MPQAAVEMPATQVVPLMHPLQSWEHTLPRQASTVLALPSSQSLAPVHCTQLPAGPQRGVAPPQLTQAAPAAPHEVSVFPALQLAPLRQPVQQVPSWQSPADAPSAQLAPLVSLAGRVHASV